ncbi:DUF1802 family protein [Paenibacillus massiliensis]|uniref:DUF1802 family protein n=1 Tax=Paenibacillus massiliensis TaxID=225917 RepID=UPI00046EF0D2|nr:DUF1802 family protein [Paenibacillus massiliensis]
MPETPIIAGLKEWASAIAVLESGRQILVMRKGGIVEETRHFELKSHDFFLYPTYEHQRSELVKENDRHFVEESLQGWDVADSHVTIRTYAKLVEDIEIVDQQMLDKLRDYHMWTDDFAEARLKWKRQQPLHVLLLQVFKLEQPVELPILPEYTGCRSWLSMDTRLVTSEMTPVLDAREFEQRVEEIKQALNA